MAELSPETLETTANAYEARLTPVLFAPFAEVVADAAEIGSSDAVLDVGCGTGVLARACAERVAADGAVTGVDLNPGMLAVAARIAPSIAWQNGNAEALPFDDDVFDAIVSQFALMLFAEPVAALGEMRRVARPGARITIAVFDGPDGNPAYGELANVYERCTGEGVANVLRAPFALGEGDRLNELLSTAGWHDAQTDVREISATFDSIEAMVLADVEGWFPLAGLNLDAATIAAVRTDAETALAHWTAADGKLDVPVRARIVSMKSQ